MSVVTASAEETIFALATPPGRSAIAVIRISGPKALDALSLFHVKHGRKRGMKFVRLKLDDETILDEVMTLSFLAPASATGEDSLEVHCHGSPAVMSVITDRLVQAEGFRPAEAGEFSRRALDNGKMQLTEIEGLADLIDADTEAQRRQATRQMGGALHDAALAWRAGLVALNADLAAVIDFADEELPTSLLEAVETETRLLLTKLEGHLNDGHVGEVIRDGLQVALIGPVNAGKSTTLNALAHRPAAIISDQAGTTRDIVEVRLDIQGMPVLLRDTAGNRQTEDLVEREGISRSRQAAEAAHLALLVLDMSDPAWTDAYHSFDGWALPETLIIANKIDKALVPVSELKANLPENTLFVSLGAENPDADLSRLEDKLASHMTQLQSADEAPLITRVRHRQAIITAAEALRSALAHNISETPELAAEDYRLAAEALGRITGAVDVEELLDHIFSSFCIGK